MAANLALYGNSSLVDAMVMPVSDGVAFFESKAFTDWKKNEEQKAKLAVTEINRINDVIKAIGILGKSLGNR